MNSWRDMIPAPIAAPETKELRSARIRTIVSAVVFAAIVLLFAQIRAVAAPIALPALVATFVYLIVQGFFWIRAKNAADDHWIYGGGMDDA